VEAPSFLRRHPWVRWLAPATVLGLAALAATGVFAAGSPAPAKLPRMTPESLISQVRTAKVTGYSGTVVSQVSLGLPELPSLGDGADGTGDSASFASLLTGSHTMQVWYGGASRQRVAVLGSMGETDLFRAGRSLWQWNSASQAATHMLLPAGAARRSTVVSGLVGPSRPSAAAPATPAAVTPGGIAGRILALIRPSTGIQVRHGGEVADRSTYQLVLTPRSPATLIGSVRIAIDGATKVPLAVQVVPRGSNTPAIDVRYTSISFGRPSRTTFAFSPPAGASVRHVDVPADPGGATDSGAKLASRLVVRGSSWSTVACYHLPSVPRLAGALGEALQPVAGSWGRGRILETNLVTLLLTRNGWLCGGAVRPQALFAAAASR